MMEFSDIDDDEIRRGVEVTFPKDGHKGFLHVGHRKVKSSRKGYFYIGSRQLRPELIRYLVDEIYASRKPEIAKQLRDSFGIIMSGLLENTDESSNELATRVNASGRYIRAMSNGTRFPRSHVIKDVLKLWGIDYWKFWEKVSEVYEKKYGDK